MRGEQIVVGRCRSWQAAALTGAVVWVLLAVMPAPVLAQPVPMQSFADLVERVGPAVVNISTTRRADGVEGPDFPRPQFPPGSPFEEFFRDFFDREESQNPPQPRETFSLGSGFVVDPAGFVVTNNHVIAEADEIRVIFTDDSEYDATIVGRDLKTDLALLKIERPEPFPAVEWADSDGIRVGDWIIAIGNPFGLGSTVTAGIVSARGRDIHPGPYHDYLQVDAAINRGNAGERSFAHDGRVVGGNTAIFSPSGGNVGIGFAIPANLAKPVIASLKEYGRVVRGWLGVRIQSVTPEIAESLGLPEAGGALVASVTPGGPAAQAAIEAGDVIVRFDDQEISAMRGLPRIVAETQVGKAVDVEIWRRGNRQTVQVTLGELPSDEELAELDGTGGPTPAPIDRAELNELGLVIAAVTPELTQTFGLAADVTGVVVLEVADGSPAAREGVQPGDVIVEVGQEAVRSPPEVMARVAEAKSAGKKSALFLMERQGEPRFVVLLFPT